MHFLMIIPFPPFQWVPFLPPQVCQWMVAFDCGVTAITPDKTGDLLFCQGLVQ